MRKIFVDTGAWDAIADSGDLNHEPALLFRDEIAEQCHLISSNYVLDELFTLLLMNIGYRRTLTYKNQPKKNRTQMANSIHWLALIIT